jgi:hypothetical protein
MSLNESTGICQTPSKYKNVAFAFEVLMDFLCVKKKITPQNYAAFLSQ